MTMKEYAPQFNLIARFEPSVKNKAVEVVTSGNHSLAVIIGKEVVYRFPLRPEFVDEYRREAALLKRIQGRVPLAVPMVDIVEADGLTAARHEMIPGVTYTHAESHLFGLEKEGIAEQLAAFLTALHQIEADDIAICQFSLDDWGLTEKGYGILESEDRCAVAALIKLFRDYRDGLSDTGAVLCHNDLNENNILIHNGKVSGIIDFGNAMRRDFTVEFAALMKYDFGLTRLMAKQYESMSGRSVDLTVAALIQRLRCYGGMIEAAGEESRISRYRRWLSRIDRGERMRGERV